MIFENKALYKYVRSSESPFIKSSKKQIAKIIDIYKNLGLGVEKHIPYDNIFHCCVQKTASQWFKGVFNDLIFYKYTGLPAQVYSKVGLRQDSYQALPLKRVATPLYISHSDYLAIPKPEHYKTFFVTRDPRDIVVSFYFSTRYSHPLIAYIPRMRKELEDLNIQDGLKYVIDALEEMGVFEAQRSWISVDDEKHKIFRYEDLANDNCTFLRELLSYLDVEVSPEKFDILYNRHAFESRAKGRLQGEEDINSHYRKGSSGDWTKYFNKHVIDHFKNVTGDLVEILEYTD